MNSEGLARNLRRISARCRVILIASAFIFPLAHQSQAATLVVGTCLGPSPYSTIQSAVNASNVGDTVRVCPGTYNEQVVILHALTLTGPSDPDHGAAVILPPSPMVAPPGTSQFPQIFVFMTTGVTVSHLTVDGTGSNLPCNANSRFLIGIYFYDSAGTAAGNILQNQNYSNGTAGQFCGFGVGIRTFSDPNLTSNVSVRSNSVSAFDFAGILAERTGTNVNVNGNSVNGPLAINTNTTGIYVRDGATGRVTENAVNDNTAFNGGFGSTGVFASNSPGVVVSDNSLHNNAFSISFETFAGGNADGGKVVENSISETGTVGIWLCSNNDIIEENRIRNSGVAGVQLVNIPGQCQGSNAHVEENVISTACAGILINPGVTGADLEENNISNTKFRVLKNSTSCQ
jgi:nitrous oxidase accessory protein NosD